MTTILEQKRQTFSSSSFLNVRIPYFYLSFLTVNKELLDSWLAKKKQREHKSLKTFLHILQTKQIKQHLYF